MDAKIVIGKIVAPHGVRGDFRILPMTETPELFLNLEDFYLDNGRKLTIINARFQKSMVLVSTEEIRNMDEAEKLRNHDVLVERRVLPALPEGRFYVNDLKGFLCVDEMGQQVGVFQDTLPTGSTDVFVIKGMGGEEILLPAIRDNILQIDTSARRMVVHLPEWLD